MSYQTKLKHFGYIQSLSFAVAMSNNLIAFALISLIPGFGNTGVVVSAGIMLFFSGIIEIPTGILGDKIGWDKTVTVGLILKVLSNIFIIGAVLSALQNHSTLLWSFIAIEAFLDAIGSALISGSYQGAYNSWYKTNNDTSNSPPLFLASYKYGFWVRILFPLITIFLGLNFIKNIQSEVFSEQILVITPLVLITLFRVLVTFLIAKDLKGITGRRVDSETNIPHKAPLKLSKTFEVIYITLPALISYSFFRFTQLSVTMIAIAEAYKIFKSIDAGYELSWTSGLLLGLAVNFLNMLYSKFFYSKIALLKNTTTIFKSTAFIILACSIPLITSLSKGQNIYINLFAIYAFCVFALMGSQTSINLFQSIIPKIAPKELQASWLSCAEFISLITFSLVLGASLLFNHSFIGLKLLLIGIIIWSVCLILFNVFSKVQVKSYVKLKYVILTTTMLITCILVIIFGSIFARRSYVNSLNIAEIKRHENLSRLSNSVRTALLQGSFVEATARIKGHKVIKDTRCVSLIYNKNPISKCDPSLKTMSNISIEKMNILMNGSNIELGQLVAYFDNTSIFKKARQLFFQIIGISFLIGLIFILIFSQFLKVLNKGISNLIDVISQNNTKEPTPSFHSFIYEFNFLGKKILKAQQDVSDSEVAKALTQNAQQVSHDIKSPLAALGMITSDLEGIDESKRIIIRSAVTRINDIANNLLTQHRSINNSNSSNMKEIQIENNKIILLPTLIDSIMTEKRMQFRDLIDIQIINKFETSSYGVFSAIRPNEFKRVCSNLLNNAVEILENHGTITVSLSKIDNRIILIIQDNGKGISPEVLSTLGQRGTSHGKDEGNGLGLYHAISSVELWGGTLKIESTVGVGTSIIIDLPTAEAPKWFVPSIDLEEDMKICILDDDESIHQIWDMRLSKFDIHNKNISIKHFSNPEDIILWHKENHNNLNNAKCLYLMDYELLGHDKTGLDVIKKLKITHSSYLVTSRYEDKKILDTINSYDMGLIPKSMASEIPIILDVKETSSPLTVLLDDDPLIHMIWDHSAKSNNINFKKFTDQTSLLEEIDQFKKDTIFYIDSSLNNDVKGEEVAEDIYNLGFHNLHLATGYEASNFGELHHIKSIVGKDVPWA